MLVRKPLLRVYLSIPATESVMYARLLNIRKLTPDTFRRRYHARSDVAASGSVS